MPVNALHASTYSEFNGTVVPSAVDRRFYEPDLPEALRAVRATANGRSARARIRRAAAEAAELMEVSVATVGKHCERALKHLRTALEVSDVS